MSLITGATRFMENAPLPDVVSEFGVAALVDRASCSLSTRSGLSEIDFACDTDCFPIAQHMGAANQRHYEAPADFFALTLGPARKYSCCVFPTGKETLAEPEIHALEATVEHADLKDGQHILALG
jgi:cyclopropane-fatty-acyl-phospholipid synthase